ncbi:MAG: hypothetical protein IJ599_00155 [Alphaproteobacteria bacterium]|nr:hypothetical protein [Alphaproteobacteria bacterium]
MVFCTICRYRALYGNIVERCIEVRWEVCSANYVDMIGGNLSLYYIQC